MIWLKGTKCVHMSSCEQHDALWFEHLNHGGQLKPRWLHCWLGDLEYSVFAMPEICPAWRHPTTEEFGLIAGALDAWIRAIDNWEPE